MKLNKKNVNAVSDLLRRSPFRRPKVIAAAVLVAFMVGMWIKVLINHRAEKNEARAAVAHSAKEAQAVGLQTQSQVRISLLPLPVVAGRNDTLANDIFTAGGWNIFPAPADTTGNGTDTSIRNYDKDFIDKIAQSVSLEAVITGPSPEAFIGNKLVSIGDTLPVRYGDKIYEFTVAKIQVNQVVLTWDDVSVVLKMSQSNEAEN